MAVGEDGVADGCATGRVCLSCLTFACPMGFPVCYILKSDWPAVTALSETD